MQTPVLTVLEEDKHAWFAGRTRAILKYLDLEMVPRKSGVKRTVLDVGGGAGNMAHHLAHYGDVISVDYSPRPLAGRCPARAGRLSGIGQRVALWRRPG